MERLKVKIFFNCQANTTQNWCSYLISDEIVFKIKNIIRDGENYK